jgi:hypothetical protein
MKEYNGTVNYTPEEYAKVDAKALATAKQAPAEAWLYAVKNPPPYTPPSKAELESQKADLEAQVASLASQISAKG